MIMPAVVIVVLCLAIPRRMEASSEALMAKLEIRLIKKTS